MRTLEQRKVRFMVEVQTRPFKEPLAGETYSAVHICMEGKRADGSSCLLDLKGNEFTPPCDDSTIVALRFKPKNNVHAPA